METNKSIVQKKVYFESLHFSEIAFYLKFTAFHSILHRHTRTLASIIICIHNASHHLQIVNHGDQIKHCAHHSHKLPFIPPITITSPNPRTGCSTGQLLYFRSTTATITTFQKNQTILEVLLALPLKAKAFLVDLQTFLHRHHLRYP